MLSIFKIENISENRVKLVPYFLDQFVSSKFGEENDKLSQGLLYLNAGISYFILSGNILY